MQKAPKYFNAQPEQLDKFHEKELNSFEDKDDESISGDSASEDGFTSKNSMPLGNSNIINLKKNLSLFSYIRLKAASEDYHWTAKTKRAAVYSELL